MRSLKKHLTTLGVRKLIARFIVRIPKQIPPFIRFIYFYEHWDRKRGIVNTQRITLTHGSMRYESVTKTMHAPQKEQALDKRDELFSLSDKELNSFYRRLRQWRFDLIPPPYTHFSYDDYSTGYSATMHLEVGNDETSVKEFEAATSSDLGLDGKDQQKFNVIEYILIRLLQKKRSSR